MCSRVPVAPCNKRPDIDHLYSHGSSWARSSNDESRNSLARLKSSIVGSSLTSGTRVPLKPLRRTLTRAYEINDDGRCSEGADGGPCERCPLEKDESEPPPTAASMPNRRMELSSSRPPIVVARSAGDPGPSAVASNRISLRVIVHGTVTDNEVPITRRQPTRHQRHEEIRSEGTLTRHGKKAGAMLNVGILVFDEVEVLDFAGPFEVFSTAGVPGGPIGVRSPVSRKHRRESSGSRACSRRPPRVRVHASYVDSHAAWAS